MTLNFPKSIYTAGEATTASISPANASPTDGATGTIGSYGFTFDDDRVDANGRWVMNSGSTYSLTGGATYTWDLYKWKASNIPDSSNVVQTASTPSNGKVLKWNGSEAVWDTDNNTTYSAATTSADGLMSSSDKSKLNGIANNANNYVLPRKLVGQTEETDVDTINTNSASLDLTEHGLHKWDVTYNGTTTVSLTVHSNATAEVQSTTLMVKISSNTTLNLPTADWIGGSEPTISSTNFSVIEFWYVGSTLYGAYIGDVS